MDYLARNQVHCGDVRELAGRLEPNSVQCIVTSPPYFNLRDYGTATWEGGDGSACDHLRGTLVSKRSTLRNDGREHTGPYDGEKAVSTGMPYADRCGKCGANRVDKQLGMEATPAEFVANLVAVFAALRPALKDSGVLWLNLGDGYANDAKWGGATGGKHAAGVHGQTGIGRAKVATGYPPKCLYGIPWRVAFALIDDGWILRSDVIWAKPAPMPESVTDRPTRSHEYLFLLTKRPNYFYDAEAIREPQSEGTFARFGNGGAARKPHGPKHTPDGEANVRSSGEVGVLQGGRNKRSVWTIPSAAFPGSHFATFPPDLVRPCILAGTSAAGECANCGKAWARVVERERVQYPNGIGNGTENQQVRAVGGVGKTSCFLTGAGTTTQTTGWAPQCRCNAPTRPQVVLDPFGGSGTTASVAHELGRDWLLTDLDERAIGWTNARLAKMPVGTLKMGA